MSTETTCAGVSKREITEKYFDTVYRLAMLQTKHKANAEDVTQEVFLKFMQTDKEFESEEHIKAWLIRVTINGCKSIYMSSWFKRNVPLDENTEELTFDTPEKSEVYYAVLELPPKYRAVIHLFYYEDLSVSDIARYLKTKESTVKSQLHRGREMLKTKLKGGCEIV